MPRQIQKNSTDQTLYVFIVDSVTGIEETGITIADLDLQYVRYGVVPVAKVNAIELAAIDGAHEDNKMKEVDATDQPGLYRVDWPDAAFATGVNGVVLTVKGTGFHVSHTDIELTAYDPYDAVRMGMTALPNAAAGAAGGLPISTAGGLDLDAKLANTNEVTAARMAILTDWINGGRLDLLLDAIKVVTDALPNSGALTDIDTGINNLETRLTAARGGYLDELAAANIPADIDTLLNRLTAARAAVLADWIGGGRLDLLLAAIPTTVMRGTDGANTIVPDVAGTAATPAEVATALTNYNSPTKAEMDAAHALLATLAICSEVRLAELDAANLPATTDNVKTVTDLLNQWLNNKIVFIGTSMILYDDDDVTPLKTWTLSGGSLTVDGPYNRSAAS